MAELTINRDITRSSEVMIRDTTEATISIDSERDGESIAKSSHNFPDSSTIAADLLLCDYVKVRKVRMGEKLKKTKVDKKLQVSEEFYSLYRRSYTCITTRSGSSRGSYLVWRSQTPGIVKWFSST